MSSEQEYEAQDAVTPAIRSTGYLGTAGLFVASIQATMTKRNIGFFGTFTRYGSTIATFAAMGGAYEFTRIASANLRQSNDTYNEAIGGFFGGAMLGLRFRSIPAVLGYGAALSVVMTAFQFSGGSLFGAKDQSVDEYERKEALRRNRRRPIQETLEELGEGRGVYGPGYEERRAQRIKERYGIDVPSTQ